jgi:hypothetical protein
MTVPTVRDLMTRGQVCRALPEVLPPAERARRDELAGPVLRRVLAHTAPQVRVEVTEGVITLTGSTDRRSTAELASELAHAVPGVVGVVDRITYADDDRAGPPKPRPGPRWCGQRRA